MARQEKSATEQEMEDFQKGMEMGRKMGERRRSPSLLGAGTRLSPLSGSTPTPMATGNTNEGAGAGGSTGRAVSFDKAHSLLMNELISRGVRPEVAAGAVGSMMGESGAHLNPSLYGYDVNGPSGGFAQWHDVDGKGGGRFTNLLNFAGMSRDQAVQGGKLMIPLETQIKFLGHELDTSHNGVLKSLQQASTVADGNRIWTKQFEVPRNADAQVAIRQHHGDALWRHWSANQGALPATATPSTPPSPQNRDAGTPKYPTRTAAADAGTLSDANNDIRRPTAIPESTGTRLTAHPDPIDGKYRVVNADGSLAHDQSAAATSGVTPTTPATRTTPAAPPAPPSRPADLTPAAPLPPTRPADLTPAAPLPPTRPPESELNPEFPKTAGQEPPEPPRRPQMGPPMPEQPAAQPAAQPATDAGGMDPLTSFLNDIFGPDADAAAQAPAQDGGGDFLGDIGGALEDVGTGIGDALGGIGDAIGGMFAFAEGGMVPETPGGDQPSQGGAPLSAAITGALHGLESVYGLKREDGAISETDDPSYRSTLKSFMNNEKGVSQEALGALLDKVGDAGQTPDPNAEALRQLYSFYADKGDEEAANKAAAGVVQAMRQRSMDYGKQAMQAMQQRDFQGAAAALISAYNEVPDGRKVTGEVNASGVGQATVLDGVTGKPVQQIPLSPQYLAMASQAFATGSEFYKHLAQFADTGEGEQMDQPEPDDEAPAEQALPVEEMGVR